MSRKKFAVVVLGHGSRVAAANEPLCGIAEMVGENLGVTAIPAFLQLAGPSLEEAVEKLVAQGYREIVVAPFFLYPGAHVTEDIPAKAEELEAAHPGIGITVTEHLGVHPLLAELVAERVRNAVGGMNADE